MHKNDSFPVWLNFIKISILEKWNKPHDIKMFFYLNMVNQTDNGCVRYLNNFFDQHKLSKCFFLLCFLSRRKTLATFGGNLKTKKRGKIKKFSHNLFIIYQDELKRLGMTLNKSTIEFVKHASCVGDFH